MVRAGPSKTRKSPKNAGTREYNAALSDEQRASIWVHTEEGHSQRKIAELLGIAPSTVSKELAQDPIRWEALKARQREDRAARWKAVESQALDETIGWLEKIKTIRTRKKIPKKAEMALLYLVPRLLQVSRHAAETGTKQVQLLTGGVTERVGTDKDDQELSPEQLIAMAVELDAIEMLPPRLREAAKSEQARRNG